LRARLEDRGYPDGVMLGLRPSEIRLADGNGAVRGEAWIWEPLGKFGIVTVRLGSDMVKVKVAKSRGWTTGDGVALDLSAAEPIMFDAATGAAV
jgi:ABC-type sugar transport system ATPase subunit